jgi:hypothetical protein
MKERSRIYSIYTRSHIYAVSDAKSMLMLVLMEADGAIDMVG